MRISEKNSPLNNKNTPIITKLSLKKFNNKLKK